MRSGANPSRRRRDEPDGRQCGEPRRVEIADAHRQREEGVGGDGPGLQVRARLSVGADALLLQGDSQRVLPIGPKALIQCTKVAGQLCLDHFNGFEIPRAAKATRMGFHCDVVA